MDPHMIQTERGQPAIDKNHCTACGLCAFVCPSLSITIKGNQPAINNANDLGCLSCGQCMSVCPTHAVTVNGRGMSPDDAFPLTPPNERSTPQALKNLLDARRSVRNYTDKPLNQDIIDQLINMASTAPMGFPPSDVGIIVVNGKDRVQELAEDLCKVFQQWLIFHNPIGDLAMRLMAGKATAALLKRFVLPIVIEIIKARKDGKDFLFYNAPCVLIFHYPYKETTDSVIACSLASIAAESLGLGSCMIGTLPPALENNKKLKEKWGVPPSNFTSMGLILGHPAVKYQNGIHRRFASVKYL